MRHEPSTDMIMFQAVMLWIVSWWLVELADGQPMFIAVGTLCAFCAMALAIMSVKQSVPQPSPFPSMTGQIAWALRPRKWMVAWGIFIALFAILGRPMVLNWYGGGRCQYIDWWLRVHVLPAQGHGAFQGCRFLAGW